MRFGQGKLWQHTAVFLLAVAILSSLNACEKDMSMDRGGEPTLSELEHAILKEINRVRTEPMAYASAVESRKQQYDQQMARQGLTPAPAETPVFADAIQALRSTPPLPALTASPGLAAAAQEHVRHASSTLPPLEERLQRQGTWEGRVAENVAYGSDTAQRFVMQFVLDPDDARRTQRANLLQSAFTRSGVACGSHPQYTTVCVVTFAQQYRDKTP